MPDYIKVTVGFEKRGESTATLPKNLTRIIGPRGSLQVRNLFSVIAIAKARRACASMSPAGEHPRDASA